MAPHASARAAISRQRSSPATTRPSRCSMAIAAAGARPGAATTCRFNRLAYACFAYCCRRRGARPARRRAIALAHLHQQDPGALSEPAWLQHHRNRRQGHAHRPRPLPQGADRRRRDRKRHHVRRYAGSGAEAVREILRPRGRLRPSPGRRPVGLSQPRGHGARHPHAGARSVSQAARSVIRIRPFPVSSARRSPHSRCVL